MTGSVLAGWIMVVIGVSALAIPVVTRLRGQKVESWWKPLAFGVIVAAFGGWFADGGGVAQVIEWLTQVKEVVGD